MEKKINSDGSITYLEDGREVVRLFSRGGVLEKVLDDMTEPHVWYIHTPNVDGNEGVGLWWNHRFQMWQFLPDSELNSEEVCFFSREAAELVAQSLAREYPKITVNLAWIGEDNQLHFEPISK